VASGMMKTLLVSALMVAQATAAVATPLAGASMGNGIDSNRAALGLPVDARVSSCVAPVGSTTASCGADASNLAGGGLTLLIALGALAAVGLGVYAGTHHDHHHGSTPVSP
jgi:hypothetical protein